MVKGKRIETFPYVHARGKTATVEAALKAAFHFRVFPTHVYARKTLNRCEFNVKGFVI